MMVYVSMVGHPVADHGTCPWSGTGCPTMGRAQGRADHGTLNIASPHHHITVTDTPCIIHVIAYRLFIFDLIYVTFQSS
jgi:hypothetical protein